MFKLSKDIDYNPGHRCCATWYRIVARFVAPEVEKINNDKNKLLSSFLAFFRLNLDTFLKTSRVLGLLCI